MSEGAVVYWRGSGEQRADLVKVLSSVGYTVETLTTLEELVKLLDRISVSLLLIDASSGDTECSNRIVELSGNEMLREIPMVFISYQAEKRSAVLKRQYQKFVPIGVPYKLSDLLTEVTKLFPPSKSSEPAPEMIEITTPSTDSGIGADVTSIASQSDTPTSIEVGAAPTAVPNPESATDGTQTTGPSRRVRSIREIKDSLTNAVKYRTKIIQNLDPANLVSSHGGELFANADSIKSFDDAFLIPNHPRKEQITIALKDLAASDEWLGLHARRVAFVSSAIANALQLGKERDTNIRVSAMLLNWGLRTSFRSLTTLDPLLDVAQREKKVGRIASGMRDSAKYVKDDLADSRAARTIAAVASLIEYSTATEDPDVVVDAHCVFVTELADRAMWGGESWDPYGVHRALRRFREGKPALIDQNVLECICRVLSEAASSRYSIANLQVTLEGENPDEEKRVKAAEHEAEQLFGGCDKVNLQVADLQPGMILARPIISWDGRLICNCNIELTDEFIYRIWQLTTIRPLRPPVSVLAGFVSDHSHTQTSPSP